MSERDCGQFKKETYTRGVPLAAWQQDHKDLKDLKDEL